MKKSTPLILASALLLTGCASNHSRIEDTYGDSVRNMVHHQIADPSAAANPDPNPVPGYDGTKGKNVIDIHTKNASKTEQVATPTVINIGK